MKKIRTPAMREQAPEPHVLGNVDPLTRIETAFDLVWSGADESAINLLPAELISKHERDSRGLRLARVLTTPTNYISGDMEVSERPQVTTRNGNFDSETIAEVRKTLEENADLDRDSIVMWRGQELVIAYGWYLVEYVEAELAKRPSGHGGL